MFMTKEELHELHQTLEALIVLFAKINQDKDSVNTVEDLKRFADKYKSYLLIDQTFQHEKEESRKTINMVDIVFIQLSVKNGIKLVLPHINIDNIKGNDKQTYIETNYNIYKLPIPVSMFIERLNTEVKKGNWLINVDIDVLFVSTKKIN